MTDTPLHSPTPAGSDLGAGLSLATPGDYFALMKPRVMSLVVFTAFVGMVVGSSLSGARIGVASAALSLLCIALGAGASGALNMWWDADIDARMTRTRQRPTARGVLSPRAALGFGTVVAVVSVYLLYVASNVTAAFWLLFTILFYVVVYSMWLKRRTPQNIVFGGLPGALPPLVGWAAVTGSAPLEAWVLVAVIFAWTPPHFWALALYKVGDYAKVGVPMLPNVAGAKATRGQIWVYALVLFAVGLLPVATGMLAYPWLSGPSLAVLGALFVWKAWGVYRSRAGESRDMLDEASLYAAVAGDRAARDLFLYSLVYLFAVFVVLLADAIARMML